MGQTEALEAIAVATGDKIRIYTGARYMPSYPRSGQVLGLTVRRDPETGCDQLIDCGEYKGIRDTLTRKTAAGGKERWRRMAVRYNEDHPAGQLFAVREVRQDQHDIFEVTPREAKTITPLEQRGGRLDVLIADGGGPYDAGKYPWPNPMSCAHEFDRSLKFSYHRNDRPPIVCGTETDPVTAAACIGDEFFVAYPHMIKQTFRPHQYSERGLREYARRETPLSIAVEKIFISRANDAARPWMTAATKEIARITGGGLQLDPSRQPLKLYREACEYMERHEGFCAIANANGMLYAGDRSGRLYMVRNLAQRRELVQVAQFDYPIEALCAMPAEMLDDGLRQKISRTMRSRFLHARKGATRLRLVA